ncbi:transcriptional regulator [Sphaerochaeta pleomorpha str. Grapes]|uniref:Transcriptional regulator n=1 Tax=Sphaerochaeta pleomorpha (strain ATCC BAA-1885 / DSM 22778 / Grapes) TaxID=158190 RepID=G8QYP4_SPHPG|nr:LacI family DNA-binding transcriptional regulator [Sphaerochaeta pleomorpha]AEV29671.1 transcriptional regulator [Sphaerochaeta pleomorpha str. Grapes]
MAKPTLKIIAEQAGVSVTLVSLVLNNKPTRVSEITRQRIFAVAKENNYVPNKLASALKSKRSHILGIVVPYTPFGFFSELIYYVEQSAWARGYSAITINTFNDSQKEFESLRLYQSGLFDGMLIASLSETSEAKGNYQDMLNARFPFVFVDRYAKGISVPIVSSDHFQIAYSMTSQILKKKHPRNILFLNREGQPLNTTLILRREGYRKAMIDAHLMPWEVSFSLRGGEHKADTTLTEVLDNLKEEPEAIFLYSGFYMPYLLKSLDASRFRDCTPEFLTVDGFSVTQDLVVQKGVLDCVANHLLFTIQDTQQIAERAVETLVMQIEKGEKVSVPYIPAMSFWR